MCKFLFVLYVTSTSVFLKNIVSFIKLLKLMNVALFFVLLLLLLFLMMIFDDDDDDDDDDDKYYY